MHGQLNTSSHDQELSAQNEQPEFTREKKIVKTNFKSLQEVLLPQTMGYAINMTYSW